MTRALAIVAALGALGFVVGFAWGRGTREAAPGATSVDYAGGVVTVRVDAARALSSGLQSGLSALLTP